MTSDPEIRELLERTASGVVTDPESALDAVLRARRRVQPAGRMPAVAAAIVLLAVLIAVTVIVWPGGTDRGFIQEGSEPSGTLAIGRRTDPSGTEPGSGLYSFAFSDRVPVPVATGIGAITDAEWSPDGARVAFTVEQDEGASYALVVARADGSDAVTVVEHAKGDPTLPGPDFISVAWSPDGTQLAYSGRTIFRGRTVSVLEADGSNERVLDGHWEAVSWAPNGEHLLLLGWPDETREGRLDLYTMRADGSDLIRLTDDPMAEFNPAWSPDGRRIAFARGDTADGPPDIYVMAADGSDVTRLAADPGFDVVPVWSPDGEWIAFASERDATPERQRATRDGDQLADLAVYVMRPDGTDVRRVLDIADDVVYPLSWTL